MPRHVFVPIDGEPATARLERQEAEAYARNPQTPQELAELDAWQEIEAWADDEAQ